MQLSIPTLQPFTIILLPFYWSNCSCFPLFCFHVCLFVASLSLPTYVPLLMPWVWERQQWRTQHQPLNLSSAHLHPHPTHGDTLCSKNLAPFTWSRRKMRVLFCPPNIGLSNPSEWSENLPECFQNVLLCTFAESAPLGREWRHKGRARRCKRKRLLQEVAIAPNVGRLQVEPQHRKHIIADNVKTFRRSYRAIPTRCTPLAPTPWNPSTRSDLNLMLTRFQTDFDPAWGISGSNRAPDQVQIGSAGERFGGARGQRDRFCSSSESLVDSEVQTKACATNHVLRGPF